MKLKDLYHYLEIYKEKYHYALNFFGIFLIVTFLPDVAGVPAGLVTNGLWAFKGMLAILTTIAYHKKIYDLNTGEKLFAYVVIVYLLNIIADVFFENDPLGLTKFIDLVSFVVSIIIAFSFRYDKLICSDYSYYFFVGTLAFGLILAYFLAFPSPKPLVGRYDANSIVNTINYGQMGCSMCLASVYGFFQKKFKYSKVVFLFLFALGMVSIMKAGSRSPILVLFLVVAAYTFARLGFIKSILIFGVLILCVWGLSEILIQLGDQLDSGLITRLINTVEERDSSGRDKIYANAINIIKESPIFGSLYVVKSGLARGSYPHNFFLECFMTTGIIGGIPFVILAIMAIYRAYILLKRKHISSWIVLMFLQLQVYGMFSSNLFSSQDYWALCLFVLGIDRAVFAQEEEEEEEKSNVDNP